MKRIDITSSRSDSGPVSARSLQHHENEGRFFAPFTRDENQKVREWHRQQAEELRRWARDAQYEWTRKGGVR